MTIVVIPALLAVPVPVSANSPEGPRVHWQECQDYAALDCASLDVPMNHADPDSRRITLALVRAPAARPAEKLGSLVLNRGGPGYSSTEYLRVIKDGTVPAPVDQRVWEHYDVIGLDQRGVGQARPSVTCFESAQEREGFNADVPVFPVTARDVGRRALKDLHFAALCRQRSGALLDHLSTATVARDLDLVRQALGESRLNYLGQSYGVHLGLAYANMFPDRMGSLVLDSVLNPARSLTGPLWTVPSERTGSDTATQEVFDEFLRLCARGNSCGFAAHRPRQAFDQLATALREDPLHLVAPDGAQVTLTYPKLVAFVGGLLYQPVAWESMDRVLDLTYRVQTSPSEPDAAELAASVQWMDQLGFDAPYTDLKGLYSAFTCNDVDMPRLSLAWWGAARRRAAVSPHFATLRAYDTSPCAFWRSTPRERYTGPWSVDTEIPVLILNNRFDGSTPVGGAKDLHRRLPNSRLIVNEGWGHITTQQSTCMTAVASAYLAAGSVPDPGTSCLPDLTPFAGSPGE
ncbi:alpha/beta hydrolase fold [Amycolatopsis marina]|uniref:Alpha/beta hydrolase fold n=1 Tax=Amycolatopsis marina TaxID=490629 RepID=A0A1I1B067_9PSEU|nr:alpha/beta hydrolase [Amycolatopsis marina]SFB43046.1 alpha/beta hydrolase fold [Amycolatopsis marina]